MRRLAEGGLEGAAEVRLGDVGAAGEGRDVERGGVGAVDEVANAEQVPGEPDRGHHHHAPTVPAGRVTRRIPARALVAPTTFRGVVDSRPATVEAGPTGWSSAHAGAETGT